MNAVSPGDDSATFDGENGRDEAPGHPQGGIFPSRSDVEAASPDGRTVDAMGRTEAPPFDASGSMSNSHQSADETPAEMRRRLATEHLKYRLGVANHTLREHHKQKKDGQRSVTQAELAKQMSLDRTYLNTRARELGIDLKPYTLLYGPPVFDPLMVIERT
jgi:hypothetical protein